MASKEQMVEAMEEAAERERHRQSVRAMKIVAALVLFAGLLLALFALPY